MAEPGANWQATDVIMEQGLPGRRLQKVLVSPSLCVLLYQTGGIAMTFRVAIFRIAGSGATLAWAGYTRAPIADGAALVAGVEKREIHEWPDHL